MSDLSIQIDKLPNLERAAIVTLKGSIDAKTVIQFQTKLNAVIEEGVNRLIIDMEQVRYVNSTGLGYLINLADTVGGEQGMVVLANVQPKVKVVFDMLGLNAFFKIYSSRENATRALMEGAGVGASPTAETTFAPAVSEEPKAVAVQPKAPPRSEPPPMDAPTIKVSPPVRREPAPASPPVSAHREATLDCQFCRQTLTVDGPGAYKCPRCFAVFDYAGPGRVTFVPRRPVYPVQMTLNFTSECTEGLLNFVRVLAMRGALPEASIAGLQNEVRNVVDTIRRHSYGGNDDNVYHVLMVLNDSELELRFVDYGHQLNGELFSRTQRAVDRFEHRPHPRGGNIISMAKKLS